MLPVSDNGDAKTAMMSPAGYHTLQLLQYLLLFVSSPIRNDQVNVHQELKKTSSDCKNRRNGPMDKGYHVQDASIAITAMMSPAGFHTLHALPYLLQMSFII